MSETVFYKTPKPSLAAISPTVGEQLKVRKELHSKTYPDPDFTHHYLTSNYAFVRLVSGINIKETPDAAKKFQLLGGALYDGKSRKGINFEKGFLEDDKGAAYVFEKEGIVPTPGITGFSLENAGEQGLMRQMNITLQCYSVDQFSILEKLYMRPGFQMVVEWGHSVYIDNAGGKVYSPKILPDDVLFKGEVVDPEAIKEAAGKLIYDSQHNYDYTIGSIMNYDWTYSDGVYSIELVIYGEGGLSEMQAEFYSVGTDKETQPDEEADKPLEFENAEKLAGGFSTIMRAINQAAERGSDPSADLKPLPIDQGRLDDALSARKVKEDVDKIVEEIGNGFKLEAYRLDFLANKDKKKFTYVPFRFILGCLNYFYLPRYEGATSPAAKFATDSDRAFYLTFENHYSIDPYVCLLPKQAGIAPLKTSELSGKRDTGEFIGDIMDIWVNTGHIFDLIMAIAKNGKKSSEKTIDYFLDSYLDEIKNALGDINNFTLYNDYYLDKNLGPTIIVDLSLTPNPEGSADSQQFPIQLIGKESFVSSFNFTSNLDSNMLNAMTTQAVLDGSSAGKSLHRGISAYSRGLTNRIKEGGSSTVKKNPPDAADKASEQEKNVVKQFEELYKKKLYNEKTVDSIAQSAKNAMNIGVGDALVAKNKRTGFAIPGTIQLTFKGIGGLKRLEYLRLPYDALPSSYKENEVVFMITNVSHSISNGIWETEISANVYISN